MESVLYKYDLAISFAGEQRDLAETFARRLDESGYSVFYDEYQQAELWGRDLSVVLGNVYAHEARRCLIILSQEYLNKPWTTHERRSAISEFIQRRGDDYILCLKLDDVELPGYSSSMGYLKLGRLNVDDVYKLLLQKMGKPNHENSVSHLSAEDCKIAQQVIEACFRRAIYSRMDSEINIPAMYDSIGKALGSVQRLTPRINDQALQFVCIEIIHALDDIQRMKAEHPNIFSRVDDANVLEQMDISKQKIVRLLAEIRRAAKIPMQLPFVRQTHHIRELQDADEKPNLVRRIYPPH